MEGEDFDESRQQPSLVSGDQFSRWQRDVETLPSRLAVAAAEMLDAGGAGLGVMSHGVRVPLGASSSSAVALERLQFTLEQGPCWEAVTLGKTVCVAFDDLAARWPEFADEMVTVCEFRSVVSVALPLGPGLTGALDLYFEDPTGSLRCSLDAAGVISTLLMSRLLAVDDVERPPDLHGQTGPRWARGTAARERSNVWLAVGVVVGSEQVSVTDGLALLKAAAYLAGRSVDAVAADVVDGVLSVSDLLG